VRSVLRISRRLGLMGFAWVVAAGVALAFASAGNTTSFGYDAAGNLTSLTLPNGNGYVENRSFDRAGRLTTVDNVKSGSSLSRFTWTLDPVGNPTKVDTLRGGTDTYDGYQYDARDRLTAACYGIASSASDCSGASDQITYSYDKVDNLSQQVRSGSVGNTGTISYSYNSADQLTSSSKGGATTSYSYDGNGNQTGNGTNTFASNLAGQLTSSTTGGTTSSYGYDGDGNRVSSSTPSGADLNYTWDTQADTGIPELALEQTSSGSLVRRYLNGPLGAVSMTNGSGAFYYHHDPHGNISDLTSSSGTAQWAYAYEPYGATRTASNVSGSAPENRLRYSGQYTDTETNHYNLRAREYDPTTTRFNALDPIEAPLATAFAGSYVYVEGQPTTLLDPTGSFSCGRFSFACDAVSGTVGKAADLGTSALHLVSVPTPTLQETSDFFAGFGDTITFGGTREIRRFIGTDDVVHDCSWSYRIGGYTAIVTDAGVGGAAAGALNARRAAGLGDLTRGEVAQIQRVVDRAGRPLEVVGSAARGSRRYPRSRLPVGKRAGTKSDIDYLIPHGSVPYYKRFASRLPDADPANPLIPGVHNPFIGPAIRFEPGSKARFVAEVGK
jgi:RHS repeat-associated protein